MGDLQLRLSKSDAVRVAKDVETVRFHVKVWVQVLSWLCGFSMAALSVELASETSRWWSAALMAALLLVASFAISYARLEIGVERIRRRSLLRSRDLLFSEIRSANLAVRTAPGWSGNLSYALQFHLSRGDFPLYADLMVQPESWQRSSELVELIKLRLGEIGLASQPSESMSMIGRRTMDGLEWYLPAMKVAEHSRLVKAVAWGALMVGLAKAFTGRWK